MPKNTDNSRTPLPPLYKDLDGQNVCVCVCYTFIWFYQIKVVKNRNILIPFFHFHTNTSCYLNHAHNEHRRKGINFHWK